MKTLYVSDLDGTLLRSNETLSEYTSQTINQLVEEGMLFSYATARSYNTAHKVTKGFHAKIPLIVYNGAFVKDNVTGEILLSYDFSDDIFQVLDDLLAHHIYPIVYYTVQQEEKFSYIKDKSTEAMKAFLNTRKGDSRDCPINHEKEFYQKHIFYITCIDEEEKLLPFYGKYQDQYRCIFQKDIYTNEQWLEIMPKEASKSNAIMQLKDYRHCDKVVVFGDGLNDIDMFEKADESYAVKNAHPQLKQLASGVIDSNDEDAVAKWLLLHYTNNK